MNSFQYPSIPPINDTDDTQWMYAMRRQMQEVLPGIFLGPYAAAMQSEYQTLVNCGITHIVCIRQLLEAKFIKPNFMHSFEYLVLDIADSVNENIIQHFSKLRDFVDACLDKGGKVLVHSNTGISRSAALLIAYIMERYGLTYKEAFLYVQQKRFCINPNEGFVQQLKEYEPIYRARVALEGGLSSINAGQLKRKHPVDDEMEISLS